MKLFEQTWNRLRRLNITWADMNLRRRHDIAWGRHEITWEDMKLCLRRHVIAWKGLKSLEKTWNHLEITWHCLKRHKRHTIAWENMKLLVRTWNYLTRHCMEFGENCLSRIGLTCQHFPFLPTINILLKKYNKLAVKNVLFSTRVYCSLSARYLSSVYSSWGWNFKELLRNKLRFTRGSTELLTAEYTQSGNGHFLDTFWRIFHHDGKIRPAWCGWRVHCPPPFHSIYHHEQSWVV